VGGKRAPLIAGAVVIVLVIAAIVILVLPKKQQVTDAKKSLATEQSQQQLLQTQLSALQQAQNQAPHNRAIIANVQRQIPPTVDEPGMLLLMVNSATNAGIKLWQFTPSTPAPDTQNAALTSIPLAFTVKGSYFALAEFLYNVETLPRVAKVQSVQIGAGATTTPGSTTSVTSLEMTGTINFYTTDTSAGPGSQPGPTTGTSTSTTTGG
jgi:Tfp pilus assembly protein PilO